GRFAEAAALLERALQVATPSGRGKLQQELRTCKERLAGATFERAAQLAQAHDLSGAGSLCNEALRIAPDFLPALLLRAQCHMAAHSFSAAEADLDRVEAIARPGQDD